ncbi:MAG: PaaI family thioesterase [Alphaproteobacteria bacterium]|nr:PaaI family thioesterase [Alphaproteobacteria bacterium]
MALIRTEPEKVEDYPPNIRSMMKKPSPAARTLGLKVEAFDVEGGYAELSFDAGEGLLNKWGAIQGGMVAAMLDEALAHAAGLTLSWGEICPNLETKVSFLSVARPGRLLAKGRMVKRGKQVGFVEAELRDEAGKLLATATGTVAFMAAKG